jgi:2-polyprenyl-3-methyl-5-hydroxy-6-metoxy-1,4-benzoquinol methylase
MKNYNDKKSDIAALESIEFAKNYNNYIFKKMNKYIDSEEVLDFGAGFGLFGDYLRKLGKEVTTVDSNKKAVDVLRKKNFQTFKALNEVNKKFDVITSLNVLEHIEDDQKVLENLHSTLNENGKLILYIPSSMIVWTKLDEIVNHYRRYSIKEISDKAQIAGFNVIEAYYVDFVGWVVLLLSKILNLNLDFDKKKIIIYDKFIFLIFKFLDIFMKNIIGKNVLVVCEKKA